MGAAVVALMAGFEDVGRTEKAADVIGASFSCSWASLSEGFAKLM